MFLNLAKNIEKNDTVCVDFSNTLEDVFKKVTSKNIALDSKLIKKIEEIRSKVFVKMDDKNSEEFL
jgi:general stress protein 26